MQQRDKHSVEQEETQPEDSAVPSTALKNPGDDARLILWLSLLALGSALRQRTTRTSLPLLLSPLLDPGIQLGNRTYSPNGVFNTPHKVLEETLQAVSHFPLLHP